MKVLSCKIGKGKSIYDYVYQYNFQPMDNDDPFSRYIYRIICNDEHAIILHSHIFSTNCFKLSSKFNAFLYINLLIDLGCQLLLLP